MSGKPFTVNADDLINEYLAGATVKDLGRKYGVNHKTVRSRLPTNILRDGGPAKPTVDITEAERLFNTGIGVKGVADIIGCSSTFLNKAFRNAEIKTRNRSEQQFARMARATPEQRLAWAKPSHDARRGVKVPMSQLINRAKARCKLTSVYESELSDMLRDRGVIVEPQLPFGPYNCDLAAFPVAVEVYGGHWHWSGVHLAGVEKRFRYILDAGWHLLVVAVTKTSPLTPAVADYVATYIENARRDPSAAREYRVIWRAGEYATAGGLDDDHISIVPPFTRGKNSATGQYQCVPR